MHLGQETRSDGQGEAELETPIVQSESLLIMQFYLHRFAGSNVGDVGGEQVVSTPPLVRQS